MYKDKNYDETMMTCTDTFINTYKSDKIFWIDEIQSELIRLCKEAGQV